MITYKFFKQLFLHIKYSRILRKVYKEENLLENLSKLFGTKFDIDWIGRIYTVINPLVSGGEYDQNTIIYEYGEVGMNTNAFVERIIMQKLQIADNFIKANNLFDLLTYRIEEIDDNGNYLFIMQPITSTDLKDYSKKFFTIWGLILLGGLIYLFI